LITGINGFVGRGLAAALQKSGRLVKGTIRSAEGNARGEGRREKGDRRRETGGGRTETEERFSGFCDR